MTATGTKDLFAYAESNRAAVLYLAQNMVNGDCYVGVTRQTLERRRTKHLQDAARGVHYRFYRAIRKYGAQHFRFSEEAAFETFKEACAAEQALIAKIQPAYNVTKGGEGAVGYRHSKTALEKMRACKLGKPGPWRGKKRPPETVEKFRARMLAAPLNYWLGKKRDQETIDKIKATHARNGNRPPPVSPLMAKTRIENMQRAAAARQRRVICLTDGRQFASAQEASLAYGFCRSAVASVCNRNGRRKAIFGLRFAYVPTDGGAP